MDLVCLGRQIQYILEILSTNFETLVYKNIHNLINVQLDIGLEMKKKKKHKTIP